jgi:hypothetical protein
VLLLLILNLATGAFWRSALVAALFALHPLRVESVAWIAERKDVLSGFFFMLTLWFYVLHAKKQTGGGGSKFQKNNFYRLSWLCFILGLLAKPMLVTVPIILLLLDFWPLKRFTVCDCRAGPGKNSFLRARHHHRRHHALRPARGRRLGSGEFTFFPARGRRRHRLLELRRKTALAAEPFLSLSAFKTNFRSGIFSGRIGFVRHFHPGRR